MQRANPVSRSVLGLVFLLLALLPTCSSTQAPAALKPEPGPLGTSNDEGPALPMNAVVESWDTLDVDEFNSQIDEAAGSGETWTRDPVQVVDRFIWGGIAGYRTWLEMQGNRLEGPDSTVITIVRDGFADDSMRGDWRRIVLYKVPDGTWRLAEARLAYRCYRGHQQDTYGKRLCL